jgi:anti-sigma factor RsiW
MPDQEPAEARREAAVPGTSRRGMLRGAAGIGAAGLAAGVFAGAVAGPASAATTASKTDDAAVDSKPLTVHIHDAKTGVMDVFKGEEHVRFTDRELAARLARAAG